MVTTMREGGLGAMGGVGLALALAGCGPWVNAEHCLFTGGDRGCEGGQSCRVVIGGGRVPGASNGCLDASEAEGLDPEQYLHLRYGLPASLEAQGDVQQSDSVQGILARELAAHGLEDVCSDEEGLSAFEAWPELDRVLGARRRLDRQRGERQVRGEDVAVNAAEAGAVNDLNARVEAWVLACEAMVDASGSGTGTGTDDATGTTEPITGSTTEGPSCASVEDCEDPAAPFCDPIGECVGCDGLPDPDGACAGIDPATPVCVFGACVECTASNPAACEGQTPICDDATNTCVPCIAHAQCGAAACDLFTGICFPEDAVVHVGPGMDFATIGAAVSSFPPGVVGTIIIHQSSYLESVVVDTDARVALLAAEGDQPTWEATGGAQLTVAPGGAVIVDGLTLANNSTGQGLAVNGGQAWLDRAQLVNNALGAFVEGGAEVVLRNCTVGYLVGYGYNALQLDSSSATILYSTLIGDNGSGNGLICDPFSDVTVRNSIVGNYDGNPIGCLPAEVSYSATTGDFPGNGNEDMGAVEASWFVNLFSGDFHLSASIPDSFATIAQWRSGDPPTDLDGDPRPAVDGTADYPGADIPML